jgi:hypothetical protein
MPAAEGDRQLPLVPLEYTYGAGQQCDGSTALTFGPLMAATRGWRWWWSAASSAAAPRSASRTWAGWRDAGRGAVAGEPRATGAQPGAAAPDRPSAGAAVPPGAGMRRREADRGGGRQSAPQRP